MKSYVSLLKENSQLAIVVVIFFDVIFGAINIAWNNGSPSIWTYSTISNIDFFSLIEFFLVSIVSAGAAVVTKRFFRSVFIGILYWFFGRLISSILINIVLLPLGLGIPFETPLNHIILSMAGYFVASIYFLPFGLMFSLFGTLVSYFFIVKRSGL